MYRSLKEKGLSKFKCSFVSDTYSPIHTNYFTKHDVYIVSNDGNHRVVWAKIIDAPFIRSEITQFVIHWDHYNTFRTRYIKGQEINKVFGSERARFLSLLNTMRLRYKDSGIFFEDKLITTVSIVDDKEIAIRQYKRYNQLLK